MALELDARDRGQVVDAPAPPAFAPAGRAPPPALVPAIVLAGVALRVWRAVASGPTFDESFTAMAGRRPVGELFTYLGAADSHPPLDYLLRAPLARVGASDLLLRAPSLVFSCAALVLFAWWMRSRGWTGTIAVALFSFSTFQVWHGGEARMYALLALLGVAGAMVAERWLRAPQPWHAWVLGGIVLLALFDHASGLLLGLGLLVACGARRDREAWRLRCALAAAAGVWTLVWGPVLLEQLGHGWSSWVPPTSPTSFARAVSGQFVMVDGVAWLALAAVAAGGVVVVRRDARLGRLWWTCGAVPFATAAAVGLFSAFLLPRTLMLASWAPVLAVAFLLDLVRRRGRAIGTLVACVVPALVLAATCSFLAFKQWDYDLSLRELERVAQPGDVVAVRPARYGILVDWRFEVRGDHATVDLAFDDVADTDARRVLGAPPSGRTWMLTTVGSPTEFPGYERCAAPWSDGVTTILCLRRADTGEVPAV